MTITKIEAIEILSSKAIPTLEISLTLDNEFVGKSIISLGTKKMSDVKKVYDKVRKEKSNIENFILKGLWNKEFKEQLEFDEYLEKFFKVYESSGFDGNIKMAISVAFLKASSASFKLQPYEYLSELFQTTPQIPKSSIKILENNNEACLIKEFYVIPRSNKFRNGIKAVSILMEKINILIDVNNHQDDYFKNDAQVLDLLKGAIQNAKTENIDFDVLVKPRSTIKEKLKMIEENDLIKGIIFDDNSSFGSKINLNNTELIVATVSESMDKEKLKEALKNGKTNVLALDLSRAHNVSDAYLAIHMAKSLDCQTIVKSIDSCEETFCSHFAFGIGSEYVMFGSLKNLQNIIKYNEILRIESSIVQ